MSISDTPAAPYLALMLGDLTVLFGPHLESELTGQVRPRQFNNLASGADMARGLPSIRRPGKPGRRHDENPNEG